MVHILLKPDSENFEYFAGMWYECNCAGFELSLALPFLGLGWKLTFSSPVATAEFSKFVGILSAALSQHHLLGFEVAQLEFHHFHWLRSWWCFLRPNWLCIPGCMALGEWSHHHRYLGHEYLFCSSVYSCHLFLISSASVRSISFLSFTEPIFACSKIRCQL